MAKVNELVLSNEFEFGHFARNLIYDVCEYYLQTLFNLRKGYWPTRAALFSHFGYTTVMHHLQYGAADFEQLKSELNFQVMNQTVFESEVKKIIENSHWKQQRHSLFYETCVKLASFIVFSLTHGYDSAYYINVEMTKMAKEAFHMGLLDKGYDEARKNSLGVVQCVYKFFGVDMTEFMTHTDKQFAIHSFPLTAVPQLPDYLADFGVKYLKELESKEEYMKMDLAKFSSLSHLFLEKYYKEGDTQNTDKFIYFLVNNALIAVHSTKVRYETGVELAFDLVSKYLVLRKRKLI